MTNNVLSGTLNLNIPYYTIRPEHVKSHPRATVYRIAAISELV